MATLKRILLVALLGLPLIAFFSCSSGPNVQELPAPEVRLLDRSEIKTKWGSLPNVNPFLEPSGLFQGQQSEFLVLELKFALPTRATVHIDAYAVDSEGRDVAWLKDVDGFYNYWSTWEKMGSSAIRDSKINSYYLPGKSFLFPGGSYRYYVVLIGKRPLTRPANIEVAVSMPDGTHNWEFSLEAIKYER